MGEIKDVKKASSFRAQKQTENSNTWDETGPSLVQNNSLPPQCSLQTAFQHKPTRNPQNTTMAIFFQLEVEMSEFIHGLLVHSRSMDINFCTPFIV